MRRRPGFSPHPSGRAPSLIERSDARLIIGFVPAALRWGCLTAALLAVALALPAGAAARGAHDEELFASPVTRSGFKLELQAFQSSAGSRVFAALERASRAGTESDTYQFSRTTFAGSANLGSATVMETFARDYGSITMTFRATEPARRVPVPKGCTGTAGSSRKGILKGSFVLRADKLGTLRIKSVAAKLEKPSHVTGCTTPSSSGHGLFADNATATIYLFVFKPTSSSAPVTEKLIASKGNPSSSFYVTHQLAVSAPRSDYRPGAHLTRGRVIGAGGISGSATYAGTPPFHGLSTGTLKGDLHATLATIGSVRPFAHGALHAKQSRS